MERRKRYQCPECGIVDVYINALRVPKTFWDTELITATPVKGLEPKVNLPDRYVCTICEGPAWEMIYDH